MSSEKCTRCGRTLRSEDSINRGMGRTCARKTRQETAARLILANYTPVQVEKVKELLRDGGIARISRHTYVAVASNGIDQYEIHTDSGSCTCPAGEHGRNCYHLASALLLSA